MRVPRFPLLVFGLSRSLTAVVAAAAFLIVHPSRAGNGAHDAGLVDVGWPVDLWGNWDGSWYTAIAEHGYRRASAPAFFPLYPYLVRVVGWTFGGHVVLAAVVVSLLCCLGSFVLLHRLAERLAGPEVARRAVLYLALFPTALFLQAAYAESLLLLLALAVFVLAEQGRIGWAGLLTGLALLTRPSAVALLPALAAFGRDDKRSAARAILLSLALFCVYPLLLVTTHHGALSFLGAQAHWGRHLSLFGPVIALVDLLLIMMFYAGTLVSPPAHTPGIDAFQHAAFYTALSTVFLAVFAFLLVVLYRRFGATSPYFLFSAVSVAIPLFSPILGNPLLSLPRFGLVVFPFYIALAETTWRRPRLHVAYVAASAPLLVAATGAFALYSWVA